MPILLTKAEHAERLKIYHACIDSKVTGDELVNIVGGHGNTFVKSGKMPVHVVATSKRDDIVYVLDALLKTGSDVNATTRLERDTILHLVLKNVALRLASETCLMILEHDPDLYIRNRHLRTPYDVAIAKGYFELANVLDGSRSPDNAREYYTKAAGDHYGLRLIEAVRKNDEEKAQECLEQGADCNQLNKHGAGAIHYMFTNSYSHPPLNVLLTMVNSGMDVNLRDQEGDTALNLAIKKTDLRAAGQMYTIVDKLLDWGANPSLKDLDGFDAFALSEKRGYTDIIKLLKKKRTIRPISPDNSITSKYSLRYTPKTPTLSKTSSQKVVQQSASDSRQKYQNQRQNTGTDTPDISIKKDINDEPHPNNMQIIRSFDQTLISRSEVKYTYSSQQLGKNVNHAQNPVSPRSLNSDALIDIVRRLDVIESKLDSVNQFEDLHKSLKIMSMKLDTIDERLKDTEEKVKKIENAPSPENSDERENTPLFTRNNDDGIPEGNGNITEEGNNYNSLSVNGENNENISKRPNHHNDKQNVGTTRINEDVKEEIKKVKQNLQDLARQNIELRDNVKDLQCRSMEKNLIFTEIEETDAENTEEVLAKFIKSELGIEGKIVFDRVHRLGRKHQNKHRPILAKFSFYKQKEGVRRSSVKLNGKPYGVNEQFPRDVFETRRRLLPIYRDAKKNRQRAFLSKDKLIIDGKRVMGKDEVISSNQNSPKVSNSPRPDDEDSQILMNQNKDENHEKFKAVDSNKNNVTNEENTDTDNVGEVGDKVNIPTINTKEEKLGTNTADEVKGENNSNQVGNVVPGEDGE